MRISARGFTRRDWLLLTALALNIGLLAFYLGVGYRVGFNSDSAAKNLVAAEILQSGSLFPAHFYFARDLWILHGHLVILAVAPFIGNTFAANAASGFVLAALLLFGLWRLLRYLEISLSVRLLIVLACATGFSTEWAEHMFGQGSYGYVCLLLVWVMHASARYLVDERQGWRDAAVAVAVYFLVGLNGARGVATYIAPVLVGLMATVLQSGSAWPARRRLISAAAAGAGLVMRIVLDAGLVHTLTTETFTVGSPTLNFFDASLVAGVFGLLPYRETLVTTPAAALYAVRFGWCLALVGCGVIALTQITKPLSPRVKFVLVFHAALVVAVCYSIFAIRELAGQPRYLIPLVFTGIVVLGIVLESWRDIVVRSGLLVPAAAAMVALSWVEYVQPAVAAAQVRGWNSLSRFSPLIEYLDKRNVRYGYATLWTGSAVTVLSSRQVNIRPVAFEGGVPVPERYMSARRWYGAEHSGAVVLILDRQAEVPLFEGAHVGIEPEETADVDRFRVYFYSRNVFADLAPWRRETFELGQLDRVSFDPRFVQTQAGVGRLVDGVLVATEGGSRPGFVAYGPYTALSPGRYEFAVDVEASGQTTEAAFWDVVADFGRRRLIREPIASGSRQLLSRVVTVTGPEARLPFEARVYFSGGGTVRVFGTRITRLSEPR